MGDLPTSSTAGPTTVGQQVERALGPAHWHGRLPFYARELSEDAVEVRAITQDVIDQEIAYATGAGLDYWAFVYYVPGTGLDTARQLYLASARRSQIGFCLIFDSLTRFRDGRDRGVLHDSFARPEHVRVLDGRPLLFFFARAAAPAEDLPAVRREVDAVRAASLAAGVGTHTSPAWAATRPHLLQLSPGTR